MGGFVARSKRTRASARGSRGIGQSYQHKKKKPELISCRSVNEQRRSARRGGGGVHATKQSSKLGCRDWGEARRREWLLYLSNGLQRRELNYFRKRTINCDAP